MTQVVGQYELVTRLASGGMAEIFAARDRSEPGRVVIIKQMLPQYLEQPEFVDMFLDEGRVVALLAHPNVVKMFDFGYEGEQPYLAMEYLHGVDLRTLLRGRGLRDPLPLDVVLSVGVAMCDALHHAHEARTIDGQPMELVHRDVSPQNVVVTFDGVPKLIDFGIAKSRGRLHETKGNGLKGKVAYMAPEQIRTGRLDRRTDIYATGVVLYELLTRRRPYRLPDGEHGEFSLMMAIVGHEIVPPSAARPELPRSLERAVLTALGHALDERFPTAAAMREALAAVARELGVEIGPTVLAAYLATTFADRDRRWNAVRYAGDDELATHIREAEQLRTDVEVDVEGLIAAETSVVALAPRDEVTVRALPPRLDEALRLDEPRPLAGLTGALVLDLGEVELVSSFGVRSWLELQARLATRGELAVYLARCSEAIIGQLAMIRGFTGAAQIASFLAPYVCGGCRIAFRHCFDGERDAAAVLGAVAPEVACPSCGRPATLDDDLAYFAPLREHLGRGVPAGVRAVLDQLADAERHTGAVDKRVVGEVTRLRLLRPIDRGFRWSRALDGLEGVVELDLTAARLDAGAGDALLAALGVLDPAVRSVRILGAPLALADAPAPARCTLVSVAVDGHCARCELPRRVSVAPDELAAMRRAGRLVARCRRCDTPLELSADAGTAPVVAPVAVLPTLARRSWRSLAVVAASVAVTLLLAALVMYVRSAR